MKENFDQPSLLRNDRNTWLIVASIISGCALTSNALTISESASQPTGNILAEQTAALGPGAQDGGRDFNNNNGPLGQTFSVSSAGLLNSISVLGRGDSAGFWDGSISGPGPFTATNSWTIQIGSVDPTTRAITPLATEELIGWNDGGGVGIADWVTFTLDTPVAVSPGTMYSFSLGTATPTGWFGVAHSDTDVYADGFAFNSNSSDSNPSGNGGGNPTAGEFGGFAAAIPANYDFVFVAQAVPEPTTLALWGLGLGYLGFRASRRRKA